MRGSARKCDVRMAQFVLKIEKLSHIMGPRASQDLRSPSLIRAPGIYYYLTIELDHAKRDSRLAAYGGVVLQRLEGLNLQLN